MTVECNEALPEVFKFGYISDDKCQSHLVKQLKVFRNAILKE
jgi:hypothetical protein